MSEAPERIWAWPSERGWYAAECSYEVNPWPSNPRVRPANRLHPRRHT